MPRSRGCPPHALWAILLLIGITVAGCGRAGPAGPGAPMSSGPADVGALSEQASNQAAPPSSAGIAGQGGVGSVDPSAPPPGYAEIFPSVAATIATAKTARVRGRLTENGQALSLDASGTTSGSDALSYLTDAAGTLTVLQVNGSTYVRASTAYWVKQIGNRAGKVVGSAWVPMPPTNALKDVTVGALLRRAVDTAPTDADLRDSTVTRTTVGDLPAYAITSPDGLRTLYVSAGSRAYPLRYVERAGAVTDAEDAPGTPTAGSPASPEQTVEPTSSDQTIQPTSSASESTLPIAAATPQNPPEPTSPEASGGTALGGLTSSPDLLTPAEDGAASIHGLPSAVPTPTVPLQAPSTTAASASGAGAAGEVLTDLSFTDWNSVVAHQPPPSRAVLPAS